MKNLYKLLSLILLISCGDRKVMNNQVTVYYIPIGSETYNPVTSKNIGDMYYKILNTNDRDKSITNIKELLVSTELGNMDALKVRVKIIWTKSKDVILIDNYGNFRVNDNTFKLNSLSLKKLTKILESITEKRNQ